MNDVFISLDETDTVLNYYALPLVNLKKKDFGDDTYTKVSLDGKKLFVTASSLEGEPNLYDINGKMYKKFDIPSYFVEDMLLIIAGKYSKVSPRAKRAIKFGSGLRPKVGKSKLISAVYRDEDLLKMYYTTLSTGNIRSDAELLHVLKTHELVGKIDDGDIV